MSMFSISFHFGWFQAIFAAADGSRDMMMSPYAGVAPTAAGQPQDYVKLFKSERDNLEFSEGLYNWSGKDVELRVLRKYQKIPS